MSRQDADTAASEPSFEEALGRLEAIVRGLEDGQLPLAEGLARYEEGVKLLRRCYQLLSGAERRIELLSRVDPDGRAHHEPLDDCALSLEEKAESRSRRRTAATPRDQEPAKRGEGEPDEIDGAGRLF